MFNLLNKAYLPVILIRTNRPAVRKRTEKCETRRGIQYYCVVSNWDWRNPGKFQTFLPVGLFERMTLKLSVLCKAVLYTLIVICEFKYFIMSQRLLSSEQKKVGNKFTVSFAAKFHTERKSSVLTRCNLG